MSVAGCNSYNDEEMYSNAIGLSADKNWNGHTVDSREGGMGHLVRGYKREGWGDIKQRVLPMKTVAGGSVEARKDSDGESSISGEVHVSVKDDDGTKVSVQAEGNVRNDGCGNVKTDGGIKVSVEKEF